MTVALLVRDRCGQYRKVQKFIINDKKIVIFIPPVARQVLSRMRELVDLLAKQGSLGSSEIRKFMGVNQRVAPLVDAGLVIKEGKTWGEVICWQNRRALY